MQYCVLDRSEHRFFNLQSVVELGLKICLKMQLSLSKFDGNIKFETAMNRFTKVYLPIPKSLNGREMKIQVVK